jgi:metallo-beta-lactamase class B
MVVRVVFHQVDSLPKLKHKIPEVQMHLAAARLAAGTDLQPYLRLAEVADASLKNPSALTPKQLMDLPAPPPGRAFDNLYFVGSKWVCATQQLNLN